MTTSMEDEPGHTELENITNQDAAYVQRFSGMIKPFI